MRLWDMPTTALEARKLSSTATDRCRISELWGGTQSAGYGINSTGEVVGYADNSGGYEQAFLYSNGSMQSLGTLGGTSSDAFGINSTGEVVGWAYNSVGVQEAFARIDCLNT